MDYIFGAETEQTNDDFGTDVAVTFLVALFGVMGGLVVFHYSIPIISNLSKFTVMYILFRSIEWYIGEEAHFVSLVRYLNHTLPIPGR